MNGRNGGGYAYPHPPPAPRTSGCGCSSPAGPLLPTPTASVFGDAEKVQGWFDRRERHNGS